jgi:hypothetical protein
MDRQALTGRSQTLPKWQGGEGVKTMDIKTHWPRVVFGVIGDACGAHGCCWVLLGRMVRRGPSIYMLGFNGA